MERQLDNFLGKMTNPILILIVVGLAVFPLMTMKDAEFAGADGQAEEAITVINPQYEPWFESFWSPPGGEIESMLFSLQAALGAGVLGYGIGFLKAKHEEKRERS
ncbi:MAG: energy-coupling factor ABC transporter substrate-binding protein [Candidatus Chlorobium antarcticum]|jgi:cobalt/nickel transport protein|nr:energy-coupling factor ABC transporter substrate-binding protein [Candidatus Chlorobium antarcticum]